VIASLHDANLALRFADRVLLLAGDGRAEVLDCAALDAARLETLYGVEFDEGRVGAHRMFTAS
jgi:iron complex transport system ATP-binding protein